MTALQRNNLIGQIISVLEVLLGNLIYACAIEFFVSPSNLIMGGATGIALFLDSHYGISMSVFLLIFNVIMLIVGWIFLGKKFALTTVISTFAYPIFMEILDRLIGSYVLTDDIFLCTFFAGIGVGVGLGLVFRAGSSTGGMDVPPMILNRYLRVPISVGMYAFDIVIILLQAAFSDLRCLLYGIVMVVIYTVVMDKTIMIGSNKTQVKIISDHAREISAAIMRSADRGVTFLNGRGGYLGNDTDIVLSVITNRELPKVEKLVHSIDPGCFMIISRVSEVSGNGFTFDSDRDLNKNRKADQ